MGDRAPTAECLVGFCLITEGKACFGFEHIGVVPVSAGDIVIKPHGDPHTVSNGSPPTMIDSALVLERILADDLGTVRLGGGGDTTEFVCGYFGCERHAARLFLAGLPAVIKINVRGDAAGQWLESSIRHLLGEAWSGRAGRAVLLSKMADALFIEALRRYMEEMPPEQTGWLAGARDPIVGNVLALLHQKPGHRATGAVQPRHAGAIALAQRAHRLPDFDNDPDALVAWHEWQRGLDRPVAVSGVKVRVADAARLVRIST